MKNTLPEEKKTVVVLSEEEQLTQLRKTLAGHAAFRRCRSHFYTLPALDMLHASKPASPTSILKKFDEGIADRRIMLNMLAVLNRDGHKVAYKELLEALNSSHIITGESIPLEQTESGVLIMLDVEKTMLLSRWMYTSEFDDAHYLVTLGSGQTGRGQCGSLTPRLLEAFPEFVNIFKERKSHPECLTKSLYPRINNAWDILEKEFRRDQILAIRIDPSKSSGPWYGYGSVAIFIKNTTRSEVLRLFSRTEQKTMTSWSFHYPKVDSNELRVAWGQRPELWIGIHPENNHAQCAKRWPCYVSTGCSYGYGAVILDKDRLGSNTSLERKFYDAIDGAYPGQCYGNLLEREIVLGFPWSPNL